jgi:UDP-N-acetylglucosamine--N-acetylmuramyl-(pentapeptide) pyrophosphoryl-undecaprenol N-acetylglucosamine transferase
MTQVSKADQRPVTLGLTGGGTAGHVWPHLALFDHPEGVLRQALDSGRLRVVYFGSQGGMEEGLVRTAMAGRWTFVALPAGKLRRYLSLKNVTDVFRVIAGFVQAIRMLHHHRVDVVFSKGGFVAAPVVWAAWVLKKPVVIHESDVTPALATRLSLPFCDDVVTAFAETIKLLPRGGALRSGKRAVALGLPLRSSLFGADKRQALRHFGFLSDDRDAPGYPVLLVFGGSLGAERLNIAVQQSLDALLEHFCIIHIVGKGKEFSTDLPAHKAGRYRQFAFLYDEMSLAYAAADVALTRAGASTLFELAAARVPMVLVPLGLDQSRGDQIVNARVFQQQGWAKVIPETELNPASLIEALRPYALASEREALKAQLFRAPGPDAAERVAQLLAQHLWR